MRMRMLRLLLLLRSASESGYKQMVKSAAEVATDIRTDIQPYTDIHAEKDGQ